MSFGGSQSTVRYALMVTDQASLPIQNVSRQITAMGNQVGTTQGRINSFNSAINTNSKTFTASANAIKTQGNALTNLNTNLKTTSTTSATLGTKIKSTAGQFAGFATGLSATSSGVLQLAAGFRDYNDAQIAVDRVTRKNSLAQEALGKAQDKLKKITDTGVKSGKAYEAALLDVNQAQQMASIQSDLLGEAQERLFDSQTQFVASVVPTVLGAVGTLGFAFKELGGEKGMGGLVEKFKGLGTSLKTMGGNMIGVGGGIKGLIGNLGALGLAAVGAVGLFEEFNAQLKIHQQVVTGAIKPIEGVTKTLDQMAKLDFSTIESSLISLVKIIGGSGGYAELIKKIGQQDIDKLSKGTTDLSKANDVLITSITNLKNANLSRDKSDNQLALTNFLLAKAELLRLNTLEKLNSTTDKTTQSSGGFFDIIAKGGPAILASAKNTGEFTNAIAAVGIAMDNAKPQDFLTWLGQTGGKFVEGSTDADTYTQSIGNVGVQVVATSEKAKFMSSVIDKVSNATIISKESFDKYDASVKAAAAALEEARKKAEAFKNSLASAQTNIKTVFKIDSNADKILKNLIKSLPNKAEKKIKLQLKFGQSVEDNKKAFNDLLFEATQVDEKTAEASAKQIIETIDKKFKGAKGQFAGLRAALKTAIADPNTPEALKTLLMNFNWDAVGTTAGSKIGAGVKSGIAAIANQGGGLASLWEGAGGKGIVIPAPVIPAPVIPAPITTAFDTGVKTLNTNVANISKTVPVISVNNTSAIKGVDVIAKRIMDLTGLKPIISLVNKQAIKAVDVVAKRIDSLTGIKPQISLQNKQAIKAVDVVAKRIDSLEKIKPSISLQNKQAIKSVDVVAKRIQGLENIHPVINVKVNIPNIPNSAKGDTSTSSKGDTSGIFVGGSKSDSGGGGGDTIINVHVMDETIMRRITARSGRGRFTMGA